MSTKQNNKQTTTTVIKPRELSAESFTVTDLRMKDNKATAYLMNSKEQLFFSTPFLRAPFGASGFKYKDAPSKEWSLSLSAPAENDESLSAEEKEMITNWFNQWERADEIMIEYGVKNAQQLFAKQIAPTKQKDGKMKEKTEDEIRAIVESSYVKVLSRDSEGKYPPNIKFKFAKATQPDPTDPKKTIKIEEPAKDLDVYLEGSKEKVSIKTFDDLEKTIPRNTFVKCIMQPKIWFVSGKFGLGFNALQILVRPKVGGKPTGYAFDDEESATTEAEPTEATTTTEQVDSDNEDVVNTAEEDGAE